MTGNSRKQGGNGALDRQDGDGSTRDAILAAAQRLLARDGYKAVTTRQIATEAGTNLALVNYYFGSKQNLLLALFDGLNRDKLHRQQLMYAADVPLSEKWRNAVRFYRQDLDDGFVRMLQELVALGYGNPAIQERVQSHFKEWTALLEEVAATYLPELGIELPPRLVVCAVTSFWQGMEVQHLSGLGEEDGRFFELLDRVGDWLEARERAYLGAYEPARAELVAGPEDDST